MFRGGPVSNCDVSPFVLPHATRFGRVSVRCMDEGCRRPEAGKELGALVPCPPVAMTGAAMPMSDEEAWRVSKELTERHQRRLREQSRAAGKRYREHHDPDATPVAPLSATESQAGPTPAFDELVRTMVAHKLQERVLGAAALQAERLIWKAQMEQVLGRHFDSPEECARYLWALETSNKKVGNALAWLLTGIALATVCFAGIGFAVHWFLGSGLALVGIASFGWTIWNLESLRGHLGSMYFNKLLK